MGRGKKLKSLGGQTPKKRAFNAGGSPMRRNSIRYIEKRSLGKVLNKSQ